MRTKDLVSGARNSRNLLRLCSCSPYEVGYNMSSIPVDADGLIEGNYEQVVSTFDDMELKQNLLRGIYAFGFEKPSAIQQRAIVPCTTDKFLCTKAYGISPQYVRQWQPSMSGQVRGPITIRGWLVAGVFTGVYYKLKGIGIKDGVTQFPFGCATRSSGYCH
ncbi:unnamed protein product [Heligmosomoides polygyrus]|uniref:RNA helicase n=1 Tax=Heligmosomoides polygyrus TaxID=6339 RepID=A0A3P8D049_HELPZ|nr:unnamed protein product [Heligmosomoides polygyrus]